MTERATEQNTAETNGHMSFELVDVTAQIAGEWLSRNQHNRNESPHRIRRYARDMTDGRWMLTHQPIAFDENEDILDGQNRLQGVIRASKGDPNFSVRFWVCRGASRETFFVVDTGRPRGLHDALTIRGETNARHIAAFTNLLWRVTPEAGIDDKGFPAPDNPAPSRALEFWEPRQHGLREAVPPMNHVYYYLHGPSSAYGGLYYRFAEIDKEDADLFYDKLAVGTHMAKDHPILVLRNHILTYTRGEATHHLDRLYIAALMSRAFNLWRQGKPATPQGLAWRRGGANPQPFPQPQ